MKEEMEALLWRYVEGECTMSEISEIERQCLLHPDVQGSISRIRLIHDQLSNPLLSQAPSHISSKVLSTIATTKSQYNGISVRPLGIFISLLAIISCLGYYMVSPETQGMFGKLYSDLPESIRQISLSVPSITSLQSYIFLLLVLVPGLYYLDQFLQKKGSIHIRTFSY